MKPDEALSAARSRRGAGGREEQDAVAAVALHDRVVAQHGVEHLRPQPDVADRADAVARLGDGDAVALARHLLEGEQRRLVDALDQARRVRPPFSRARSAARRARRWWPCDRRRSLSAPPRARLRSSSPSRSARRLRPSARVSLSSSVLISACAKAISFWTAWIFRRWSSPPSPSRGTSTAGPAGPRRPSRSPVAPRWFAASLFLGGRDALTRRLEPRFERFVVLGFGGQLFPGRVGGGVECLQRDESFQIGVHSPLRKKKAPPERSLIGVTASSRCLKVGPPI